MITREIGRWKQENTGTRPWANIRRPGVAFGV